MSSPSEATRTLMFTLCILGLWAPFPVWFVGALVFVLQMASAPASGAKRTATALLMTWGVWLAVFIVAIVLVSVLGDWVGVITVPSLMLPILYILMVAFVIVADWAFRVAHGASLGDLSDMRALRGVHLGLNLAGMFVFPIFTFIGIPLTLAKIARVRRTSSGFGWAVAFGVLTLFFLAIVILVACITASIPSSYSYYDDGYYYNGCRKRSALQVAPTTVDGTTTTMWTLAPDTTTTTYTGPVSTTSMWWTWASGYSLTATPGNTDPVSPTSMWWTWASGDSLSATPGTGGWDTFVPWDPTTSTVTMFTDWATGCDAFAGSSSSSSWSGAGGIGAKIWADISYYRNYSQLDEPGTIIAVVVLSMLAFIFHITFTVLADQIILKQLSGTSGQVTGVVISQVPGVTPGQPLVHPCASCGTPLQFNRTGPTTQVQCYQCRAIVEFTTA